MAVEINNRTRQKIEIALLQKTAETFLKHYRLSNKDLSVALVGDRVIRRLNRDHRRQDRITDVLSFGGDGQDLGEIIIDYAQIKRQARRFSPSVRAELVFMLVHGLFHLIGYDDDTPKKKEEMIALGRKFIEKYQIL